VKKEKPEYFIFWVPALSLESFKQVYTEIVRILRIPTALEDKEDVHVKEDVKELVR
jgi:hypothetical protein